MTREQVEFHTNVRRIANALERIADVYEKTLELIENKASENESDETGFIPGPFTRLRW